MHTMKSMNRKEITLMDKKVKNIVSAERRYWERVCKDNLFYSYVSWMSLIANIVLCFKFNIPLLSSLVVCLLALYWVYKQNGTTILLLVRLKEAKARERES